MVKFGKTYRLNNLYITDSNYNQALNYISTDSIEPSYFHQDFQGLTLNFKWTLLEPRNGQQYDSEQIKNNKYISGFNFVLYENIGDGTGINGAKNRIKIFEQTGIKDNFISYTISGEDKNRRYSAEVQMVDFTGNISSGITTTYNPPPEFNTLNYNISGGILDFYYEPLTGSDQKDLSNNMQGMRIYHFSGLDDGTITGKLTQDEEFFSSHIRYEESSNGVLSIELYPSEVNYFMPLAFDTLATGLFDGQEITASYDPKLYNLTGYRVSNGNEYQLNFDKNYRDDLKLIETEYVVTGEGVSSQAVQGYNDTIFLDKGILFGDSLNTYEDGQNKLIFDNSISIQEGFNVGRRRTISVEVDEGLNVSCDMGLNPGHYWQDNNPVYHCEPHGENLEKGGEYNYAYYSNETNSIVCASYSEIKSDYVDISGVYTLPKNDPNSYDIKYRTGENFMEGLEKTCSYLNGINEMPAVIINPYQWKVITSMNSGLGWVGLRRNNVAALDNAFSEKFLNNEFFDENDFQQESSRSVSLLNSNNQNETLNLTVNDIGEDWAWVNNDGSHIYKYAGSGYEKIRRGGINIDIRSNIDGNILRSYDEQMFYPPPELQDVCLLFEETSITFEYDFKHFFEPEGDGSLYLDQNYSASKVELYGSSEYGFDISSDTLINTYTNENSVLNSGIVYQLNKNTNNHYFKILPYDEIGSGVLFDVNETMNLGAIKGFQSRQINTFSLDPFRQEGTRKIHFDWPMEHFDSPMVSLSVGYEGVNNNPEVLGANIEGQPTSLGIDLILDQVPPYDGYYINLMSDDRSTNASRKLCGVVPTSAEFEIELNIDVITYKLKTIDVNVDLDLITEVDTNSIFSRPTEPSLININSVITEVEKTVVAPVWMQNNVEVINVLENTTAVSRLTQLLKGEIGTTYSIRDQDKNIFSVDPNSGVITFNEAPDYESGNNNYTVVLTASNSGGSADLTLSINVVDVPDVAPSWAASFEGISINENTTSINRTTTLNSGDSSVIYKIREQDKTLFNLNSTSGALSFKSAPDYESGNNLYNVVLTAENTTGSDDLTLEIEVLNTVDVGPSWQGGSSESIDVLEGTTTINRQSTLDEGEGQVVYSISEANLNIFNLNTTTGVLSFKSAPDYDAGETFYSVLLTATTSAGSDSILLNINIINQADNPPVWSQDSENINIVTGQTVVDYDSVLDPGDAAVTYSLSGSDAADLNINSSSGSLSFINPVNYGETVDWLTVSNMAGHASYDVCVSDNKQTMVVIDSDRNMDITSGRAYGYVHIYEKNAQEEWQEVQVIEPTTGGVVNNSVKISSDGSIIAVGTRRFRESKDRGKIRFYSKNAQEEWVAFSEFTRPDPIQEQDEFDINDDATVLIIASGFDQWDPDTDTDYYRDYYGVYITNPEMNNAKVYNYDQSSNSWIQKGQTIERLHDTDYTGKQILIDSNGSTIVVASQYYADQSGWSGQGAIRMFEYNSSSSQWVQVGQTIIGESDRLWIGYYMVASNGLNVIATTTRNNTVRVYARDDTKTTSSQIRYLENGSLNSEFGPVGFRAIGPDIESPWDDWTTDFADGEIGINGDGDTIIVADRDYHITGVQDVGKIYIFNRDDSSDSVWVEEPVSLTGKAYEEHLGDEVYFSPSGDMIVSSALQDGGDGGLYIFEKTIKPAKLNYSASIVATSSIGSDSLSLNITVVEGVAPSWGEASLENISMYENSSLVNVQTPLNPGSGSVTYSIGGQDSSLFNLNQQTGELRFINLPDYESGKTNYKITLIAQNYMGSDSLELNIDILNLVDESKPMLEFQFELITEGNKDPETLADPENTYIGTTNIQQYLTSLSNSFTEGIGVYVHECNGQSTFNNWDNFGTSACSRKGGNSNELGSTFISGGRKQYTINTKLVFEPTEYVSTQLRPEGDQNAQGQPNFCLIKYEIISGNPNDWVHPGYSTYGKPLRSGTCFETGMFVLKENTTIKVTLGLATVPIFFAPPSTDWYNTTYYNDHLYLFNNNIVGCERNSVSHPLQGWPVNVPFNLKISYSQYNNLFELDRWAYTDKYSGSWENAIGFCEGYDVDSSNTYMYIDETWANYIDYIDGPNLKYDRFGTALDTYFKFPYNGPLDVAWPNSSHNQTVHSTAVLTWNLSRVSEANGYKEMQSNQEVPKALAIWPDIRDISRRFGDTSALRLSSFDFSTADSNADLRHDGSVMGYTLPSSGSTTCDGFPEIGPNGTWSHLSNNSSDINQEKGMPLSFPYNTNFSNQEKLWEDMKARGAEGPYSEVNPPAGFSPNIINKNITEGYTYLRPEDVVNISQLNNSDANAFGSQSADDWVLIERGNQDGDNSFLIRGYFSAWKSSGDDGINSVAIYGGGNDRSSWVSNKTSSGCTVTMPSSFDNDDYNDTDLGTLPVFLLFSKSNQLYRNADYFKTLEISFSQTDDSSASPSTLIDNINIVSSGFEPSIWSVVQKPSGVSVVGETNETQSGDKLILRYSRATTLDITFQTQYSFDSFSSTSSSMGVNYSSSESKIVANADETEFYDLNEIQTNASESNTLNLISNPYTSASKDKGELMFVDGTIEYSSNSYYPCNPFRLAGTTSSSSVAYRVGGYGVVRRNTLRPNLIHTDGSPDEALSYANMTQFSTNPGRLAYIGTDGYIYVGGTNVPWIDSDGYLGTHPNSRDDYDQADGPLQYELGKHWNTQSTHPYNITDSIPSMLGLSPDDFGESLIDFSWRNYNSYYPTNTNFISDLYEDHRIQGYTIKKTNFQGKYVEIGDGCIFYIANNGDLYSAGNNTANGILGRGQFDGHQTVGKVGTVSNVTKVKVSKDSPISRTSLLTSNQSLRGCVACLQSNGYLYWWGENIPHKIMNSETSRYSTPQYITNGVEDFDLTPWNIVVKKNGKLYVYGDDNWDVRCDRTSGSDTLLNSSPGRSARVVRYVDSPDNINTNYNELTNVAHFAIGHHCLVAITDDGKVYAGGRYGAEGQGQDVSSRTGSKLGATVQGEVDGAMRFWFNIPSGKTVRSIKACRHKFYINYTDDTLYKLGSTSFSQFNLQTESTSNRESHNWQASNVKEFEIGWETIVFAGQTYDFTNYP